MTKLSSRRSNAEPIKRDQSRLSCRWLYWCYHLAYMSELNMCLTHMTRQCNAPRLPLKYINDNACKYRQLSNLATCTRKSAVLNVGTLNMVMYCGKVCLTRHYCKWECHMTQIASASGDQNNMFMMVAKLLHVGNDFPFPSYESFNTQQ